MNKKLFIFAHPDDEAFGPAGTIAKLAKDNEVLVVSLCNGARPGAEHVLAERMSAFESSCELLGAKNQIYNSPDCTLTYDATLRTIETIIKEFEPDTVYTHNVSDIHLDHRVVAECVMVACRPKPDSTVKAIYTCEMPSSTAWSFGKISPVFVPNVYVDITDTMSIKKQALELYTSEVYKFPDARSIEAVETLAKYRGYQAGYNFAEAMSLVFNKQ